VFFRSIPARNCGETDPVVLEFDYLGDKDFNIASSLRDLKWQTILDEIAKCEAVCVNCHRKRTAQRARSLRLVMSRDLEPNL
jgi:hypothetical protein